MSPLRVELQQSTPGTITLSLRGRLVGPAAVMQLIDGVANIAGGLRRLVVDLDGLEFMDCAGVGALAQIVCACRSAGRELIFRGGNSRVREILGAVGFAAELTFADDEEDPQSTSLPRNIPKSAS
jgi:anti-anti-sigma factor